MARPASEARSRTAQSGHAPTTRSRLEAKPPMTRHYVRGLTNAAPRRASREPRSLKSAGEREAAIISWPRRAWRHKASRRILLPRRASRNSPWQRMGPQHKVSHRIPLRHRAQPYNSPRRCRRRLVRPLPRRYPDRPTHYPNRRTSPWRGHRLRPASTRISFSPSVLLPMMYGLKSRLRRRPFAASETSDQGVGRIALSSPACSSRWPSTTSASGGAR